MAEIRTFESGATRNADTEKLERAWAAGLFDGEGSVSWHKEGKRRKDGTRRMYPRLYVGNTDRRLLEWFKAALGRGKIYGPYGRFNAAGVEVKPMYHWTATHKQGREAVHLLRPFVSVRNLDRITDLFTRRLK